MSVDREYRIKIGGEADSAVAASKAATEGLEGTGQAAKQATSELERYEAALQKAAIANAANAGKSVSEEDQALLEKSEAIKRLIADKKAESAATEGAGKKTEEATKHVDKHTLSHSQLHKVIHALNGVLPGFGYLLQAAISPIGATVAVAITVLEKFKEHIKEVNEELDKMGEEAAQTVTHRLEANKEAMLEGAIAAAKFEGEIERAANAELKLADASKQASDELKNEKETSRAIADAYDSVELAMLESLHERKLISEVQYLQRKARIELDARAEKRRLELEDLDDDLAEKEALRQKLDQQAQQYHAGAQGMQGEVSRLRAELKAKELESKDDEEAVKKADEKLKRYGDALNATSAMHLRSPQNELEMLGGDMDRLRRMDPQSAEKFDQAAAAQRLLDAARKRATQNEEKRIALATQLEEAEAARKELAEGSIGNIREGLKLDNEIEFGNSKLARRAGVLANQQAADKIVTGIHTRDASAAAIEANPIGNLLMEQNSAVTAHGRSTLTHAEATTAEILRLRARMDELTHSLQRDQSQR